MLFTSSFRKEVKSMGDKNLVMTFMNREGSRASLTLPAVKDNITEIEVATAMDAVILNNIFSTTGGDLVTKHSAQIVERSVTDLEVR
jgi:hypothetical protein